MKSLSRSIDHQLASCEICGRVSPIADHNCPRCHSPIRLRKTHSIQKTIAYLTAAVALYIPANILPILKITELGDVTESTIIEGIIEFWKSGAYPISFVIIFASIVIPILKIIALIWLCLAATNKIQVDPHKLSRIYHLTELFGRWSMIDIFVVAILVTMGQIGNYMTVTPSPGSIAFAGVVILTMLSAMTFDPRLLWDQYEHQKNTSNPPTQNDLEPEP